MSSIAFLGNLAQQVMLPFFLGKIKSSRLKVAAANLATRIRHGRDLISDCFCRHSCRHEALENGLISQEKQSH